MARKTYQPRPLNLAHETEFFRLVQVPQTDGETRRGFVAGLSCQPGDEPDEGSMASGPWTRGYLEGGRVRRQMIGASMASGVPRLHRKMWLAVLREATRVGKAALA